MSEDIDSVSITDMYMLRHEVERRAKEHGLAVSFEDVPTAYTTGTHIVFPAFGIPLSKEDYQTLRGMIIHEPLHIQRKEFFEIAKREGLKQESNLYNTFNALEDEIMEHEHSLKYRGDALDLNTLHNITLKKIVESLKTRPDVNTMDEASIKRNTLLLLLCAARSQWAPITRESFKEIVAHSNAEAVAELEKLYHEGYIDKLGKIGDTNHVFELAKDVALRIFGPDDKETDEPKQEEPIEVPATSNERCVVVWSDIKRSAHSQEESNEYHLGIDYSNKWAAGTWQPLPNKDIEILNAKDICEKGTQLRRRKDASLLSLKGQLPRLINIETRSIYESEKTNGKISNSNLYRVVVPQVGDGDWNSRVFKTRVDRRDLDTCAIVLVDWSGSMVGRKMELAANAAYYLYEVFSLGVRIPIEIDSFTHHFSGTKHAIIKDFKELALSHREVLDRFSKFMYYTGGNADADAILWAHSRIIRRKEKRKIIFVLSDGSPADGIGDHDAGLVRTVRDINKSGIVEVYGIGMDMHNIKRYYGKNCQNIDDISNLGPALLNTLHDVFIKGSINANY